MNNLNQFIVIAALSLITAACVTSPTKINSNITDNTEVLSKNSHNIDHIEPIKLQVSAIKNWQNTKVFVQHGDIVTIKAFGSWSPWPALGLWSGPEGSSFWVTEVEGINGSALMARLGYKGTPISISNAQTFRANDYGMLYLAMNDPFEYSFDNEGEMNTEIFVDRNKKLQSVTGNGSAYQITSYNYDDRKQTGSISSTVSGESFAVRKWLLVKIGEIASSKNISLKANKNTSDGGAYRVLDEKIIDGILTIEFETVW